MSESSRQTDDSLRHALHLARRALSATPSGLLTDFDGTLSPIVADPASARLVEGVGDALASLADQLALVAVITGRAALDAQRLMGVSSLLIVGNHGVEWLEPHGHATRQPPDAEATAARLDSFLASVPALDGVVVEHKGLSATVHYRGARAPAAARLAILTALSSVPPLNEEVEVREGRMSIELRPRAGGDRAGADKGSAAREIVERHGLRGVVVLGDDVTDLDMFRAVADLRAAGRVRGAIIAVGGRDREVPSAVADAAEVTLRDPHGAAALLTALASEPISG